MIFSDNITLSELTLDSSPFKLLLHSQPFLDGRPPLLQGNNGSLPSVPNQSFQVQKFISNHYSVVANQSEGNIEQELYNGYHFGYINFTSNDTLKYLGPFEDTTDGFSLGEPIYIFDRPDVRALLIFLYSIVFITGFVGNLIVLFVMWLHPRMRSTTNFFLTNLAVADFCVIIFCVLQNLSLYLAQTWIFGDFLCKMYNFVNSLSHTASVMILVVNCLERYVAIMRPFKARTILSHKNLLVALLVVWICSGIYCSPRLLYFGVVLNKMPNDQFAEVICTADRKMFNSRTFDSISFILLYLIPLLIISVLYIRIARFLWINGVQINHKIRRNFAEIPSISESCDYYPENCSNKKRYSRHQSSEISSRPDLNGVESLGEGCQKGYMSLRRNYSYRPGSSCRSRCQPAVAFKTKGQYHSNENIRKWRKVVKLLVTVVICFALCNLPHHLRKMLSYYYSGYNVLTDSAQLAIPLTQVLTYLNSAMNPILYSFMSHNFRFCIKEILTCQYTWRGKRRPTKKTCKGSVSSTVQHLTMDSLNCHTFEDRQENGKYGGKRF